MIYVLVYNLVRAVMLEAAQRQGVAVNRISFADALHWLKHAGPEDELPKLVVNPHRPNRIEPRVLKRRPKPYDLMNRPRQELRNALRRRKKAVSLVPLVSGSVFFGRVPAGQTTNVPSLSDLLRQIQRLDLKNIMQQAQRRRRSDRNGSETNHYFGNGHIARAIGRMGRNESLYKS